MSLAIACWFSRVTLFLRKAVGGRTWDSALQLGFATGAGRQHSKLPTDPGPKLQKGLPPQEGGGRQGSFGIGCKELTEEAQDES